MPVPMPGVRRPAAAFRWAMHRAAFWSAVAVVAAAVAVAGLDLRRWAWEQTEPIRFVQDINNAFRQGTRTLASGYVERYDNNAADPVHGYVPMGLDYGPGRLAIATAWTYWVRSHVTAPSNGPDPYTDQWYPQFYDRARQLDLTYALCRPLLMVNLTGEALSAAAMFLLVRRFSSDGGRRPARGAVTALVATTLFWLNPALIWNAHCWPQWDSWLLPFLLWATLAASAEWWFTAGALIGIGAMFKGQILFASPFFLLWPLWKLRLGAMARWVAGLAVAAAAVTGVWDVRSPGHLVGMLYEPGYPNWDAVRWVAESAVAFAMIVVAVRCRATWARRAMPAGWTGWADRDPSLGRVAAGAAAILVGLGVAAVLVAAAIALAASVSVIAGAAVLAMAIVIVVWAGWLATGGPSAAPRLLAAVPWPVSLAMRATLLVVAVLIVGGPLWRAHAPHIGRVLAAVVGVEVLLPWVSARSVATTAAAWLAGSVLLCLPLFGGSGEWFAVGIAHGTTARPAMSNGPNNNLANLLGSSPWEWSLEDATVSLPPGRAADGVARFLWSIDRHAPEPPPPGTPVALPMKYLLLAIWAAMVAACASGAARHARRRDPRFLLAVAAPWVAMFAVMPQMHQRYLLWGAALTSMSVAVSPGLIAVNVLLAVVSAGQEMYSMADEPGPDSPRWRAAHADAVRAVHWWTPGMGWAVVAIACLLVYLAAAPGAAAARPGRGAVVGWGVRSGHDVVASTRRVFTPG